MDVQSILAELKHEQKETRQKLAGLNRALKVLRTLRGPMHGATLTTKPSIAANRKRGRKAWLTRMRNQREKLSVMKTKRAA
jgi:hypothetical protein